VLAGGSRERQRGPEVGARPLLRRLARAEIGEAPRQVRAPGERAVDDLLDGLGEPLGQRQRGHVRHLQRHRRVDAEAFREGRTGVVDRAQGPLQLEGGAGLLLDGEESSGRVASPWSRRALTARSTAVADSSVARCAATCSRLAPSRKKLFETWKVIS
jgi:hypothetical protein